MSTETNFEHAKLIALRKAFQRKVRRCVSSFDEGAAMVEMALMMPVMCLLMTGIFAFSAAYYQKLELANAVATGGRFLSLDRGDTDPCASTASKIYAAAPTLGSAKMTMTIVLNGTSYPATAAAGTTPSCSGTTNMVSGGTAQVSASYPCKLGVYGMKFSSCSLTETSNVVVQ